MQTNHPVVLSPRDVAGRLGICESTVRHACSEGEWGAFRVRRQWRIPAARIDALVRGDIA